MTLVYTCRCNGQLLDPVPDDGLITTASAGQRLIGSATGTGAHSLHLHDPVRGDVGQAAAHLQ